MLKLLNLIKNSNIYNLESVEPFSKELLTTKNKVKKCLPIKKLPCKKYYIGTKRLQIVYSLILIIRNLREGINIANI